MSSDKPRKVFYIDTGKMSKKGAEEHIRKVKNQMKKKTVKPIEPKWR